MWKDAALLTASCVLFVQMGLSEAVQETLKIKLRPLSCVKCLSFWLNLTYLLLSGQRLIDSVAAAFLCSYSALWLALIYDKGTQFYNKCYEKFTNQDTETEGNQTPPNEVS